MGPSEAEASTSQSPAMDSHVNMAKSFCDCMEEIRECQWYWGALPARVAIKLLRNRPIGTFLVRDSHSDRSIFSISYRTEGGVYHSRLARFNGRFCLGSANSLICSASLKDFIEMTMRSSATASHEEERDQGNNVPLRILMHPSSADPSASPIELKYPLQRNEFLPSLKHVCRLVIRRCVNKKEQINNLPLPENLKRYLSSPFYLNVCEETGR